jgi:hypothetical protein
MMNFSLDPNGYPRYPSCLVFPFATWFQKPETPRIKIKTERLNMFSQLNISIEKNYGLTIW